MLECSPRATPIVVIIISWMLCVFLFWTPMYIVEKSAKKRHFSLFSLIFKMHTTLFNVEMAVIFIRINFSFFSTP